MLYVDVKDPYTQPISILIMIKKKSWFLMHGDGGRSKVGFGGGVYAK